MSSIIPIKAVRALTKSGGTLATGIMLNKDITNKMIEGHNDIWYHEKSRLLEHIRLIGEGSSTHKKALEAYRNDQKIQGEIRVIAENIFRAVMTDLKLGAAGLHIETILSLLSECGVDIGQIGHSRKHLPDIMY